MYVHNSKKYAPLENSVEKGTEENKQTFQGQETTLEQTFCLLENLISYIVFGAKIQTFWITNCSRQLSVNEAGLLAPVLLVISMLMATPIFFKTMVHNPKFEEPWSHIVYCVEDWSSDQSGEPEQRIYYSIFSMSMQYVIPFVSMALIYLKIFYYLKGSLSFALYKTSIISLLDYWVIKTLKNLVKWHRESSFYLAHPPIWRMLIFC